MYATDFKTRLEKEIINLICSSRVKGKEPIVEQQTSL